MAFTPTDPTKAEVRVTGTAPNQQLDFYIPRGAKGEPGGIVLGTILGTTDLNSITTPGTYRQSDASGNSGSLANNYPFTGSYGILNVFGTTASDVVQEFHLQSYNNAVDARRFYRRAKSNGVWSPWRCYNSTRVDQTAGRAIYQWDDVNSREQLVYGDTGRRNITSSFPSPVAGAVYLSRSGQYANLIFADYQDGSANGILSTAAGVIPVGFRPQNWLYQPAPSARLLTVKSDGGLSMSNHSATVWQGAYTWRTEDAWPTTLPGTAIGSIPNL